MNKEVTMLAGLIAFTLMELMWDCATRVTIMKRWLYYRGDCNSEVAVLAR